MTDRYDDFVSMSVVLTGVGRIALNGTGVGGTYLSFLDRTLVAGLLDELLAVFARLPSGADRDHAVGTSVMADPKLGPIARNIIVLWYTGSWLQLPDAWRAAFGTSPGDTTHVLSGAAYQAGLQWLVAGAHPAGAAPQGYGSWTRGPAEWAA